MPVRVVVGEDDVLFREGIARILEGAGLEVVAQTGRADDFLRRALAHRPDVAVVDVQMPPDNTDDGLRAALELRNRSLRTGVVILSQFFEESTSSRTHELGGRPPRRPLRCRRRRDRPGRRGRLRGRHQVVALGRRRTEEQRGDGPRPSADRGVDQGVTGATR